MDVKKIILILSLLTPFQVQPREWTGTVIGISDGDTIKVLAPNKNQVKIRLSEIDAPEKKQAFGTQSKKSLSDICFKQPVIVDDKGQDKYKRTLARLSCNGVNANAEQVKRGMAWAYAKYLTDQNIAALEESAKTNKIGLWAGASPQAPWEFRHGRKAAREHKPSTDDLEASLTNNNQECGNKRKCGQMSDCAEATFYLNECGRRQLDRDRDGIPCESICK